MAANTEGTSLLRGVVGGGFPVGTYLATFVDCLECPQSEQAIANQWAPQIQLVWEVVDSGKTISRYCNANAGPRTDTLPLLAGLLGRPLRPGEEWDLTECVGQTYKLVVGPSKNGNKTLVTSCTLVEE